MNFHKFSMISPEFCLFPRIEPFYITCKLISQTSMSVLYTLKNHVFGSLVFAVSHHALSPHHPGGGPDRSWGISCPRVRVERRRVAASTTGVLNLALSWAGLGWVGFGDESL